VSECVYSLCKLTKQASHSSPQSKSTLQIGFVLSLFISCQYMTYFIVAVITGILLLGQNFCSSKHQAYNLHTHQIKSATKLF